MKKNKSSQNSPYQWFRGENAPQKQKNNVKSVWKIFRIFIYVLLLGLSLTGCVQSMVIRTDTRTGSGLEFYQRASQIPPHMTTFDLSNKYGDQKVLGVDNEANFWLKTQPDIDEVHKQIGDQGGTFGGKSSGGRAWRAKNEGIRFSNGVTQGNNTNLAYGLDGKPLAVSTTQTTYESLYSASAQSFEVLVPTNMEMSKLIEDPSNMYNLKEWKVESISYAPKARENATQQQLQSGFTYDSYFAMLHYLNSNSVTIDATQQIGNQSTTEAMNNQNKAFVDSYITIVASTNQFVEKDQTAVAEHELTNAATLNFSRINEARAIVTWADSWHLGPFYGLFVYPLSRMTLSMTDAFPIMNGWSSVLTIFLLVLVLKTFAYLISFKSTLQQVKQQEVQAKIAQINAKYEPYKGNRQMDARKKQETFDLYKKEGISPLGVIGNSFITMPIFLSMWRVIGTVPFLKSTSVAGIVFAATSYQEVFAGNFQYLFVMILSSGLQLVSILLPRWLSLRRDRRRSNIHQMKALKKQNKTQTIIAVVYAVIAAILPAGVSVYMIFTALYQIGQNALNHKIIKWQSIRNKRLKIKA